MNVRNATVSQPGRYIRRIGFRWISIFSMTFVVFSSAACIPALAADVIQLAQTEERFLKSLRQAAERGNAIAQFNLGTTYSRGKGVAQDDEQAVFWYQKAAEQGHVDAQKALKKLGG